MDRDLELGFDDEHGDEQVDTVMLIREFLEWYYENADSLSLEELLQVRNAALSVVECVDHALKPYEPN